MNTLDSGHLGSLNYQLNMRYQEQNTQALIKTGGKTYLIEQQSIRFEFELTVNHHTQKQFQQQSEWQKLAQKLMDGKPQIATTPAQAQAVIGEEGFYGITKTAQRLAQFVIQGAGQSEELLQSGRSGILKGFKEAEKIWGEKLPDIAQETIQKALAQIDEHIASLGFSILNTQG